MRLVLLLAQSATLPPSTVALAGPYVISGVSLVSVITLIFKVGTWFGAWREFKETYDKERSRSGEHVTQNEMQLFVKHIDARFDEMSRQLAELRKLKLESNNR